MEEMDSEEESEKGDSKEKERRNRQLQKWKKKQRLRGVVYLSKVPFAMKPTRIRQIFSQYGKVDRVYLTPCVRKKVAKKKTRYLDGWVEFLDKRVAKRMAEALNTTPVGGSRRSVYYDDLWNIKYLSGFKWTHLTEKMAYDTAVREQRLRMGLSQAKKANAAYTTRVDKAVVDDHVRQRKEKRQLHGQLQPSTTQPQPQQPLQQQQPQHEEGSSTSTSTHGKFRSYPQHKAEKEPDSDFLPLDVMKKAF